MRFVKQLGFTALFLDIFISVKSRDVNNKQFEHSLWIKAKGDHNSIGIQLYMKGFELLSESKRTFIPIDLSVHFHASCRFYKLVILLEKLD